MNVTQRMNVTQMESGGEEDVSPAEIYVVMVLLSLLSVMGTAGNALVLYVFAKKKDKLVSTLFILVLAFVDFTTCLVVIPFTIYMEYTRFRINYDILCKTYQFLITSNIPFSALIMAAIAIDRYLCICHPFLHALNLERAKYVTAGLGLFSVGLGIIVALSYGIYTFPGDVEFVTTPAVTSLTSIVMTTGENLTINHKYLTLTYDFDTEATSKQINTSSPFGDSNTTEATIKRLSPYEYTGYCVPDKIILGMTFLDYYQKFYIALFLLCLIVVIFLYSLIYSSVLQRRSKRQKQKSKALLLVQSEAMTNSPETIVTVVNSEKSCHDNKLTIVNGDALSAESHQVSENDESRPALRPPKKHKRTKRNSLKKALKQKTAKKDRTLMANIKTAAMLFVVTVVFIATFLPAFLIALQIVPYNIIVFNMYFANNVANPIIYSFMNKNFREDLRKIFC